ncbi:hypothetical protein [Streptomyces sp. SID3343]|uniref:hypothetical protein n=1 Tax=Streptomyces sp. SID3343 TaxID=2690260 RepID=UPI0013718882|nr:hypothetical protein [Streptomyces sp. SID3343]MYW02872.1 hypothetical protein [Streptomyces sp. SID3343]
MGSERPEGVALSLRATERALRAYRVRAGVVTGAGVAAAGTWFAILHASGYAKDGAWAGWAALLLGLGIVALVVGVGALVLAHRMRRTLTLHPWVTCRCRFRDPADGDGAWGPPLVIQDPITDGTQYALTVVSMSHRWWHLDKCDGGDVWFAGDPAKGGVVSPPGGELLLWTRPSRLGRLRRLARRTNPAGA